MKSLPVAKKAMTGRLFYKGRMNFFIDQTASSCLVSYSLV
jgi:hypothetical protein